MDHEKFKVELEEIAAKSRDPNTPKDELIGILAESIMYQAEHEEDISEECFGTVSVH